MRLNLRKAQTRIDIADDAHVELRHKMVREQIESRGIADSDVLRAMRKIPRHQFIECTSLERIYSDFALPIDCNQTLSQPYIVALMTEILQLDSASKVLEIGTGCGYQTAVLGEIAARVYTVEIIENLADGTRKRLDSLGYENIRQKVGNGYYGWTEHAPYDRIIVTAAPNERPDRLIEQLVEGGRLVLPIGDVEQRLVLIQKGDRGIREAEIADVRFVPMVDG